MKVSIPHFPAKVSRYAEGNNPPTEKKKKNIWSNSILLFPEKEAKSVVPLRGSGPA
jgi:hypothetical protein